MKNTIIMRVCAVLLLVATLLSLGGCAARTVRPSSNAEKVVGTAGEIEILYDEYYYLAMTRIRQLKVEHGDQALSDPAVRETLKKFVMENLLTESHALIALGLSYGIDIEKGTIADSVKAHMEGILEETFQNDRDAYIESLRESYLTDRYIRTFVAVENYLSIEIIKEMLKKGELDDSDETALAYLRGGDENEKSPDFNFIRIRQVFIESKYSGGAEKAKKKAEDLRATVAAASTDEARNAAMLDAMSESRDFTDIGDGIYFARGEMEKSFERAAFDLPLYGVSEVIEVEGGFTFIMRLPKVESYLKENLSTLKNKTYFIVLNEKLDKWLSENPLTLTSFGESLDPAALEAIEPDGGEGIITVIWIGAAVVLLVVGVWVMRVLLLRRKLKKAKLPAQKKAGSYRKSRK